MTGSRDALAAPFPLLLVIAAIVCWRTATYKQEPCQVHAAPRKSFLVRYFGNRVAAFPGPTECSILQRTATDACTWRLRM